MPRTMAQIEETYVGITHRIRLGRLRYHGPDEWSLDGFAERMPLYTEDAYRILRDRVLEIVEGMGYSMSRTGGRWFLVNPRGQMDDMMALDRHHAALRALEMLGIKL